MRAYILRRILHLIPMLLGITFLSFKPCCYRLKEALQDTMLSNPSHVSSVEEDSLYDSIITGTIIDVDEFEVQDKSEDSIDQ